MQERVFLKAQLASPDAPDRLQASIMAEIERSMLRQIWIEASIAFVATLSLVSYLVWSWQTIWLDLQESSFVPLARLVISDPDILFSNVQETAWSLIETAPVQSILLGLGIILCLTCTIGFSLRLREVRHHLSPQLT